MLLLVAVVVVVVLGRDRGGKGGGGGGRVMGSGVRASQDPHPVRMSGEGFNAVLGMARWREMVGTGWGIAEGVSFTVSICLVVLMQ